MQQPSGEKEICTRLQLVAAQITHPHLLQQCGTVDPRHVASFPRIANSTVSPPAFLFRDDEQLEILACAGVGGFDVVEEDCAVSECEVEAVVEVEGGGVGLSDR